MEEQDRIDPSLDAVALILACLHDDDDAFEAIITASDEPEYLRRVIVVLSDVAMAEIRDHHGPLDHAVQHLADYRQFLLGGGREGGGAIEQP